MRDPRDLYEFDTADADVIGVLPRGRLTLVTALPSVVDAGSACRIAASYLRDTLRHVRLVSFDPDELLDYRSTRPQAVYDGHSYSSVTIPQVSLHLMYDEADRPFLLLDGPEPDLQWRRMAEAVIDLVEYFGVDQVVSMNAIPMGIPHTRPISLVPHANAVARERYGDLDATEPAPEPEGADEDPPMREPITEIMVPADFGAYLEQELERAGYPARGFAAQVPHYLARSDFPAGALALLRRVSETAGLELPLVELGDIAESSTIVIDESIEDNEELRGIIETLEHTYDHHRGQSLLPGVPATLDMPTADEIGDHFERFLANRDPEDDEGR